MSSADESLPGASASPATPPAPAAPTVPQPETDAVTLPGVDAEAATAPLPIAPNAAAPPSDAITVSVSDQAPGNLAAASAQAVPASAGPVATPTNQLPGKL